jgi:hypothetical protein
MLHERVHDLPSSGEPPADVDEADSDPEIDLLSLPEDIARLERLRASAYAGLPDLTRVPTDVFVWRAGEPSRRAVTKIAGLPYRRAGLPGRWPHPVSRSPSWRSSASPTPATSCPHCLGMSC